MWRPQGAAGHNWIILTKPSGYFTLIYAKKTKIDSSTKSFEDGYRGTQRFNFQSATDVTSMVPAIKFTTSGAATITLWWASGGNGRQFAIYDEAGTYRILSPESSYGRGVRVYSIHVVQGGQAPERNSWDSVAAPAISSVVQNGGELEVTVDMPIGPEGADSLVVAMLSADGKELKASTITAAGQTHSLPFAPVSSGTYYISAVAKRPYDRYAFCCGDAEQPRSAPAAG